MGNGSKKSDKDKGNGSKHGSKNGKDKKDEKTGGDAQAGDGFTAEQDAQLMQMKTENKPWRDVCEALGKPQDVLKNRFKEIKPDGWQPGKGGKQGGGDIQNQKQEKPEKQDKKEKANGSAKADGGTKESKKENKKQKAEKKEVKAGNGQKYETIEEDDDFPADAVCSPLSLLRSSLTGI